MFFLIKDIFIVDEFNRDVQLKMVFTPKIENNFHLRAPSPKQIISMAQQLHDKI